MESIDVAAQPLLRRQPLGDGTISERFDQVVHSTESHGGAYDIQFPGRGYDDDIRRFRLLQQGSDDIRPLLEHGVTRKDYHTLAVGAGATAIAAIQRNTAQCVMTTQPTVGARRSSSFRTAPSPSSNALTG